MCVLSVGSVEMEGHRRASDSTNSKEYGFDADDFPLIPYMRGQGYRFPGPPTEHGRGPRPPRPSDHCTRGPYPSFSPRRPMPFYPPRGNRHPLRYPAGPNNSALQRLYPFALDAPDQSSATSKEEGNDFDFYGGYPSHFQSQEAEEGEITEEVSPLPPAGSRIFPSDSRRSNCDADSGVQEELDDYITPNWEDRNQGGGQRGEHFDDHPPEHWSGHKKEWTGEEHEGEMHWRDSDEEHASRHHREYDANSDWEHNTKQNSAYEGEGPGDWRHGRTGRSQQDHQETDSVHSSSQEYSYDGDRRYEKEEWHTGRFSPRHASHKHEPHGRESYQYDADADRNSPRDSIRSSRGKEWERELQDSSHYNDRNKGRSPRSYPIDKQRLNQPASYDSDWKNRELSTKRPRSRSRSPSLRRKRARATRESQSPPKSASRRRSPVQKDFRKPIPSSSEMKEEVSSPKKIVKPDKISEDMDVDDLEQNTNDDQEPVETWHAPDVSDEEESVPAWTRSSPADLYFRFDTTHGCTLATKRMQDLEKKFDNEVLKRSERMRASKPAYERPSRPPPKSILGRCQQHKCGSGVDKDSDSSSSSSSADEEEQNMEEDIEQSWMDELNRKRNHPELIHNELWYNEPDEMNDGPLCRCSSKARMSGIRHNIYPGEEPIPKCDHLSNNPDKLYHYHITMSPHTNFLTKNPSVIEFDNHEYIFEGFSIFSHYKLTKIPVCKVIRFNIQYTIHWIEEEMPQNFTVQSADMFTEYLFKELLELYDLDWFSLNEPNCARFHILPRFSRDLPDNGKEILSMNEVLNFLLRASKPLILESDLPSLVQMSQTQWPEKVDDIRGMIVTRPGMRPSSLRIDQLDREEMLKHDGTTVFPKIIHFGVRPAQLSYAGDPMYQKTWKQFMKLKHLLANKPKVTAEDRSRFTALEDKLQEIRLKGSMKREVTVEICSEGFIRTGIKSDICQHGLLLPVLIGHLRFHKCLDKLEEFISYSFQDRYILQLAMTHPSYRLNFGTNADHTRNSLSNCGIRQLEYGDRRVHHMHTRKRGINTLIHIMAKLGRKDETPSEIKHYERLEFLGDAVVEFLSSIHLFFLFPNLEEGGLATYRSALVQNQHLSVLAKKLHLQDYMLYAHGPDLCQDYDLRHAMANSFEALMGALLLDGGIDLAGKVFSFTLFGENKKLYSVWTNLPKHPLQEDEPGGDRHWITSSPILQRMLKFEENCGMTFDHIRLLARSFTMRNVGYNHLTLGHNQRLEFLGDTVLQFISSDYLFRHFPEHHEGHLSLLRSSLVSNRTQGVVCDDLGLGEYIISNDYRVPDKSELKFKEKADLVESFLGALYVDKGLEFCRVFCHVCFYPRLKQFIMNQDWNDPKSQLQQCCLTLRELNEEEPDIPTYKVLQSTGPTNTRKYHVAVYFRGERLATGVGHSIQLAQMDAAACALSSKASLFPHLLYQKAFLRKKFKRYNSDKDTSIADSQTVKTNDNPRKGSRSEQQREKPVDDKKIAPSLSHSSSSERHSNYNRSRPHDHSRTQSQGPRHSNRYWKRDEHPRDQSSRNRSSTSSQDRYQR